MVVISSFVMTLMFDSGVILKGEHSAIKSFKKNKRNKEIKAIKTIKQSEEKYIANPILDPRSKTREVPKVLKWKTKSLWLFLVSETSQYLLPGGSRGGEFGAYHMVFGENEQRISNHNQSQWTNEREPWEYYRV